MCIGVFMEGLSPRRTTCIFFLSASARMCFFNLSMLVLSLAAIIKIIAQNT